MALSVPLGLAVATGWLLHAMARYGTSAPPPPRVDGELRFGELRAALDQAHANGRTHDARHLETLYYRKWSAILVFAANYAPFMVGVPLAESGVAPPIVIEWAGNVACAAVALTLICSRWLRVRRAA